jgi:tRNA threonylcarbamoyladenosine biosynthesis protein TsaB
VNLLALDTSSLACTVAVQIGEQVFTRHEEQPREHTRLLIPMIRSVLADADTALSDLDGIVLGNGPGSFIGMRIAASVAQGLAYGADLKIAPVSSMAAVAAEAGSSAPANVAVAQDAHMQEVYLGLYAVENGQVSVLAPERLQRCDLIVELGERDDYIAAGYGWQRFPALLEANSTNLRGASEVLYPHARFLLRLGIDTFERGEAVAAENVIPAYLRQKVAEKPHGNVR